MSEGEIISLSGDDHKDQDSDADESPNTLLDFISNKLSDHREAIFQDTKKAIERFVCDEISKTRNFIRDEISKAKEDIRNEISKAREDMEKKTKAKIYKLEERMQIDSISGDVTKR